jgi:plasmid stability protein
MSVQITIRDVPNEVRDELAARAARSGQSMQEYLKAELERLARRPTIGDWLDRVRGRKELARRAIGADVIVEHRDAGRRR